MIPIPFRGYNRLYRLDGAMNLPAYNGKVVTEGMGIQNVVQSLWRLTDAEIAMVSRSHCIWLSIVGVEQPPISLWVMNQD